MEQRDERLDVVLLERIDVPLQEPLRGLRVAFGDGTLPTLLRLTESHIYPKGTLQLTYETAGAPTYGDMAAEQ